MTQVVTLGTRSYVVVAPPGDGPWPVVMMLHGAGGTAEWTLRETRWDEHARRGEYLLVLPEATRPDPSAPASFLVNPQVWNDSAGAHTHPPRPDVDDVAFLLSVLDDLAARFAIDPARVYVTGFSNGAAMTFRFASERADRVAAIAPVAGYCNVEPRPSRPVPTLYMIGAADPLVPLKGGEVKTPWGRATVGRPSVIYTVVGWATAIGCFNQARMIEGGDGVTIEEYPGPAPYIVYTIDGLGHHWPGGRGELLRRIAGPPSSRVDGCGVVWDFFRQQRIG
jgi:polyhydroxybutyrate depolymerase